MRIFINGLLVDFNPEKDSVILVFENDNERIHVGKQLLENFEPKEGIRKYGIFPEDTSEEQMYRQMEAAGIPADVAREALVSAGEQIQKAEFLSRRTNFMRSVADAGGSPTEVGKTIEECNILHTLVEEVSDVVVTLRDKQEATEFYSAFNEFVDKWEQEYNTSSGKRVISEPGGWWNRIIEPTK